MIALPLILSGVGRWFSRIPRKVWLIVGIIAAVLAAGFILHRVHAAKVSKVIAAAEQRGSDRAYADINARTRLIEKASANIATKIRSKTNEATVAIARAADDVRVRGPGKATYQCGPVVAGGAGRRVTADRETDAPVAAVPDQGRPDLIVVPFAELIEFAEAHDLNRSDVIAERGNRAKQLELLGSTNK